MGKNTMNNHFTACKSSVYDAFSAMKTYKLSHEKCIEYLSARVYQSNDYKRLSSTWQAHINGMIETLWEYQRQLYLEHGYFLNGKLWVSAIMNREPDWPGYEKFTADMKTAELAGEEPSGFWWKELNSKGGKVRYS